MATRRKCKSGKIRYRDLLAAQIALADLARRRRDADAETRAYRCPDCKGFHLTSKRH